MRRSGRWVLNGLTALSLLLGVATIVLWLRSYRSEETFGWYINHWEGDAIQTSAWTIDSDSGGMALGLLDRSGVCPRGHFYSRVRNPELSRFSYLRGPSLGYAYRSNYAGWQAMGFAYYHGGPTPNFMTGLSVDDRFLLVPHGAVLLAFILLPALRIATSLRGRRAARCGLCPACGYDLRATPQRCPECGTAQPVTGGRL